MSQIIRYIAELTNAPDVTLNGTADLTYGFKGIRLAKPWTDWPAIPSPTA